MKLTIEQQAAVDRDINKNLLIKGCAGSGKSLVALFRAKKILESSGFLNKNRVLLFTFNKTLVNYLEQLKSNILRNNYSDIKIINFHKWAYDFIRVNINNSFWPNIKTDEEREKLLQQIIFDITFDKSDVITPSFALDEIELIKENLMSKDEYMQSKQSRTKYVARFTTDLRTAMWEIYLQYLDLQRKMQFCDFSDYGLIILKYLENQNGNIEKLTSYTHLIIDEVQDFTLVQLQIVQKLFGDRITLIGDVAQKIYNTGFSWKRAGYEVQGRTVTLKKNFRNPKPIFEFAKILLEGNIDTDEIIIPEYSNNEYIIPEVIVSDTLEKQVEESVDTIKSKLNSGESVAVIHRTNKGVITIIANLTKHNICAVNLRNFDSNTQKTCVIATTMHSIKGLEFDNIFIFDLQAQDYFGNEDFSDFQNSSQNIEKSLLFTSITRAKKQVYLAMDEYSAEIFKQRIDAIKDVIEQVA